MKNNGKSFGKGKFSSSKNDKREFKKKDGKDSSSTQGILCYECNGYGNLKKECLNYLRGKGKVLATTLCDSKSSKFNAEGECDNDGNYLAFTAITTIDSRDELSDLVDELGVHPKVKKLIIRKMRMCTSMKVRRTFRKCMMHCLKIVANMPKSQRMLLKR